MRTGNHVVKKISVVGMFFLLGMVYSAGTVKAAEVVDRIVAVVNNEIISLYDLNRVYEPYREKIRSSGYPPEKEREMLYQLREDILNRLIDEMLTTQEVTKAKISVSDTEIDQALERIKSINYYTDEDLNEMLKREGWTISDYRENIKTQILRTKLVNLEVRSKIIITDDEIRNYYEDNLDDFAKEKKYHLKNIVIMVSEFSDAREREEIKQGMESIRDRILNGEKFEDMADRYSESPLKTKGGDLGYLSRELFSQTIWNAVKDLKPGEMTPVIETDQGYQIFYVADIDQGERGTLEEARPEIEEILYNRIVSEKFQEWLDDLRNQSHIKIIR